MRIVLIIVIGAVVLAVICGFLGRFLVKRGLQKPWAIARINSISGRVVNFVKVPITVAVLDEVATVLRAGNYTQNIAVAIRENRGEIKEMVAEQIKADPTGRHVGLVPFHDKIIEETTDLTIRVMLGVLADPRTDELISDMLRENITQIQAAVRAREG